MFNFKLCDPPRWYRLCPAVLAVLLLTASVSTTSFGNCRISTQDSGDAESDASEQKHEQEVLYIDIMVRDADGRPVADATVTPWALGCSMGHGMWSAKATGGVEPVPVKTDSKGQAKVAFPKYTSLAERVSTTTVSVSINHSEHPYVGSEHITVPTESTHEVALPAGARLEIKATADGEIVPGDEVRVMSTSGRPGVSRSKTDSDGAIVIPPMPQGAGQLLLVRFIDQKPTHFSPIVELDIDPEKGAVRKEVELEPAGIVQGRFSDNVPRPVRNGRVVATTIGPGDSWNEISWRAWAEVDADGTFRIDSWPADQPMQLIALCDGYYARPGDKPSMVSPERARGSYQRAQVFMEPADAELVVQMNQMADCQITVQDAFGKPVSDVVVSTNPNIGWWNSGSQIYCYPLIGSVEWLATGKYESDSKEGIFAYPFSSKSDQQGRAVIQLPVGSFSMGAGNKKYQMPIKVGQRAERIEVKDSDSMAITLVVQPKGLEVLGDWEDLCGLVFG